MKQLIALSDPKFDTRLNPRAELRACSFDMLRLCLAMVYSGYSTWRAGPRIGTTSILPRYELLPPSTVLLLGFPLSSHTKISTMQLERRRGAVYGLGYFSFHRSFLHDLRWSQETVSLSPVYDHTQTFQDLSSIFVQGSEYENKIGFHKASGRYFHD